MMHLRVVPLQMKEIQFEFVNLEIPTAVLQEYYATRIFRATVIYGVGLWCAVLAIHFFRLIRLQKNMLKTQDATHKNISKDALHRYNSCRIIDDL